jgi:hypothetical protein
LQIETPSRTSNPVKSLTISPTSFDDRNNSLEAATNELLLIVTQEQLSEEGKRSSYRQRTDAPPIPPVTFQEFLEFIYPGEVFQHLQLTDILQVRLVSRAMQSLVGDYLGDAILPYTRIIFRYKTPGDVNYPSREWESEEDPVINSLQMSKALEGNKTIPLPYINLKSTSASLPSVDEGDDEHHLSGPSRPSAQPTPAPSSLPPQVAARHAAVFEKATHLLNNDKDKLAQFKSHVSAFRHSESSASDLIDRLWDIFDAKLEEFGKLITSTADLFDYDAKLKRSELLGAWNNWKIQVPSITPQFQFSIWCGC